MSVQNTERTISRQIHFRRSYCFEIIETKFKNMCKLVLISIIICVHL